MLGFSPVVFGISLPAKDRVCACPLNELHVTNTEGRIAVSLSALGLLGKQKDYWPDATAVVAALAICLSVWDGTANRSVMPNSGSCMALT